MGIKELFLSAAPQPSPSQPPDPGLRSQLEDALARIRTLESAVRSLETEWQDWYEKAQVRLGRLSRVKQEIQRLQDDPGSTNDQPAGAEAPPTFGPRDIEPTAHLASRFRR